MVRTLTGDAETQKNATRTAPINIIKIEFGGAIGTKFYSDQNLGDGDASSALNAAQRVISWGALSFGSPMGSTFVTADTTSDVEFQDADKSLLTYFRAVAYQNKDIIVYQHFSGLGANDLQAILEGIISDPPVWSEGKLRVRLTDLSYRYRTNIGTIITREDLPYVAHQSQGQTVPLIFGSVKRSRCLGCQDALVTHLIRSCVVLDDTLFVENAEDFPQNETITIRVGSELMIGSFAGNTFTITDREWTILTSTVSVNELGVHDFMFIDWGLNAVTDDVYKGLWIKADVDWGGFGDVTWHCQIESYGADKQALFYENTGADPLSTLVAGEPYEIVNKKEFHKEGTLVFATGDYKYIVSDAPCADVKFLESYGRRSAWQDASYDLGDGIHIEGSKYVEHEGWFTINPNLYVVDKNDTSIYGEDHPVTTVTFPRHLHDFEPKLAGIYATVDGVESTGDGTGSVYTDPSAIIYVILNRFVGVPVANIDAASISAASSAGTVYIPFGFVLTSVIDSIELCANLAFQARCMLLWEGGQARLLWLKDSLDASSLTISDSEIVQTSLSISRSSLDEIVSEVEGIFYPKGRHNRDGEKRSTVVTDAAVEAAYGRRVVSIDLWAHTSLHQASMITTFWHTRWKWVWERIEFSTFLTSLELERQDVVELDWVTFFMGGQKGRVLDIGHTPGSHEGIDVIRLKLELPIGPGCETTCEVSCETQDETGCLSSCEASGSETCWQCETSCEDACELFCTSSSELGCVFGDSGCALDAPCPCEVTCETGCMIGGCDQESCQTTCQDECEIAQGCETGCETSCETDCETVCETGGCETSGCEMDGCETSCETGCETTCEKDCESAACEGSCETDCELDCEIGGCQGACESACELDCESAACEGACETDCQVGGCETEGCQGSCESACEKECEADGCEGSCETDCEKDCEAISCQGSCETSCEKDCEFFGCQQGCETDCETGCETTCETGCETSCETGCETSVEDQENDCNNCDERIGSAIPDILHMTNDDLTGDFAQFNDKLQIDWVITCNWQSAAEYPQKTLSHSGTNYWEASVITHVACIKIWNQDTSLCDPVEQDGCCDPTIGYTEEDCIDPACGDTNSCEDSVGATCVVSTS